MKCSTHLTYGILTGVSYAVVFANTPEAIISSIALASLGSLLPDIDSSTSTITNLLVVPKYLPLKHRGFMHSATLAAICTIINVPFGLGVTSHILLDLLNYRKIKLFAPFSDKKFALKLCKSDGIGDKAMRILGTGLLVFILLS